MIDTIQELSKFIFVSKYARYNEDKKRREIWEEAIDRVMNMHLKKFKQLEKEHIDEIKWAFDMVKQKKVVPSMRSLQFGGKAIEASNPRLFNCSVRHIDSLRAFSEVFYLLLCGCGVGIGVSKYFLNRLPDLVSPANKSETILTYVVEDSIEGWADSLEALLMCYFKNTPLTGRKIVFDYGRIRPEGAPLKTSGGKAPGYKGLKNAHDKIQGLLTRIIEKENKRLLPIYAYDILMHASDAVLSGGIRRSATAVIFDKDDEDMMNAKTYFPVDRAFRFSKDDTTCLHYGKVSVNGQVYDVTLSSYDYTQVMEQKRISWIHIEPQRARSNNSVLLLRDEINKSDLEKVISKTREFGEPGFVFASHKWQLFNPCYEIGFIPVTKDGVCGVQFCNLTSINGAKIETKEDFILASKAASIIGTLQATYTDFSFLHPVSRQLTEEEALLGISITGIMDNPKILLNSDYQQEAAHRAIITNRKWARILGIKEAARITCVKPEGTSSLVLGSASGIHPHHARKYFRRVQCNKLEPPFQYFKSINPHMCEPSVWCANNTDEVITFPIEIPEKAMIKSDLTALKHLKIIKDAQENWVVAGMTYHNKKGLTHNISCTVLVKDEEWKDVIEYIYKNRDYFGAVAFLSHTGDKDYKQAPLEAITTEEDEVKWKDILNEFKSVDYSKMIENEDMTELIQEVACGGGVCEIIR